MTEVDYSRKWLVMGAISMGIFLATIDGSIVNLALPTIVSDLATNFAAVQWVVLVYLLTLTTLLLSVGRFADIVGKKKIYTLGFVVFIIGSALCGLSPSVWWLIGFRVLQAVGASMILALGPALLIDAFPPSERGQALGLAGTAVSIGFIAGPALGGLVLEYASWHWIFYVNVPIGILGTIIAARVVPDVRPAGGQRFDFVGSALLFVGLLTLLLALSFTQQVGLLHPGVLALLGIAAVSLGAFVLVELRIEQPLINLRLFRNPDLSINVANGFITFMLIAAVFLLIPFYLEGMLGFSPRDVGLIQAIVPILLGIASPISGWLSDRYGTRGISIIGLAVLLVGYALLSTFDAETSVAYFLLALAPIGIGMGIFQSPNNSGIMAAAPLHQRGVISSLLAITRTMGQTVGIAVIGALWASRVVFYEGAALPGGATTGSVSSQILALHDTFVFAVGLIALALVLGVGGWLQHRRATNAGAVQV